MVDDDLGSFIGTKDIVGVNDDVFVEWAFVCCVFLDGVTVGVGLDGDESLDGAMVDVAMDELVVLLWDDLVDRAMLEIAGEE